MPTITRRRVSILLAAACLTGCASTSSPYALPDHPRNFDPRAVQFPTQTPYDDNPTLRAVYQNYYWFGYADALQWRSSSLCDNSHPWYEAQARGYSAGLRAGARHTFPTTSPAPQSAPLAPPHP